MSPHTLVTRARRSRKRKDLQLTLPYNRSLFSRSSGCSWPMGSRQQPTHTLFPLVSIHLAARYTKERAFLCLGHTKMVAPCRSSTHRSGAGTTYLGVPFDVVVGTKITCSMTPLYRRRLLLTSATAIIMPFDLLQFPMQPHKVYQT